MHREEKTDVLVVGAGPVGMLAALRLAEGGARVKIIDQEERPAAHSYACALHPQTLDLLARTGLGAPVVNLGRQVDTIGFYEGQNRRAEINFSQLPVNHPFLLVLPQCALENLLEHHLNKHGVTVAWNHRLSDLTMNEQSVVATVDTLGETAKGYIVQEWEWEVVKQTPVRAAFVVGADGHNSLVRQNLGIECKRTGEREFFAVFEFESDADSGGEMRVALGSDSMNVFWPLASHKARWSFQLTAGEASVMFPAKDRANFSIRDAIVDEEMKRQVHLLAKWRAPWFTGDVRKIEWAAEVEFEHCVAKEFGRGRCWLAGDAAHQTGPVGVQSMNAGMAEAVELADRIKKILDGQAPQKLLEEYNSNCREGWKRLLGINGGLRPANGDDAWVKKHCSQLRSCIPASGTAMTTLAAQLGMEFE